MLARLFGDGIIGNELLIFGDRADKFGIMRCGLLEFDANDFGEFGTGVAFLGGGGSGVAGASFGPSRARKKSLFAFIF